MAGVQTPTGGTKLHLPRDIERRSNIGNSLSPVGGNSHGDRWWANNVAASLQRAVSNDASPTSSSAEVASLSVLTKEIAKHIASNVPEEVLAALINEIRGLIQIVGRSCSDQLDGSDEDAPNNNNEDPNTIEEHMNKIVSRKIPQEMSKWVAREIYARLLAAGEDISSTEEDDDDDNDLPVDVWKSARGSFDVRNEAVLAKKIAEAGGIPDHGAFTSPDIAGTSEACTPVASSANGSNDQRIYVTEDTKQRSQAFRKFKQVLGGGTGFRVIKHNHGGGRKTRVLKYNVSKNKLHWESSRMLGGEHILCSRIVKVHREITVVYVWYMTGGRHGSVKKMVGFETQREADAQILELALLYLKDHGSHTTRG